MHGNILVIAPHPDDEVLGVGGTIARLAEEGHRVVVAIVTKALPPAFDPAVTEQSRHEALAAHRLLGVAETVFLDIPAVQLDQVPHAEVNARLGETYRRFQPRTLFLPFVGDIHMDHQRIFLSAMVAARPQGSGYPAEVYAYETLSETNWNAPYLSPAFVPNTFVNIERYLDRKIAAMETFRTQIRQFPHERSSESLRALAMLRGSTVGVGAAEGFVLVRRVV